MLCVYEGTTTTDTDVRAERKRIRMGRKGVVDMEGCMREKYCSWEKE